jgi:uncharacterized protein (DUF2164 family)
VFVILVKAELEAKYLATLRDYYKTDINLQICSINSKIIIKMIFTNLDLVFYGSYILEECVSRIILFQTYYSNNYKIK